MQRWLALTFGLAVVGVALYVLAGGKSDPPMGEIDSDSRAQLKRVLEEADGQGGR